MKTLIVYASVHHGNTRKIAQVMAEVLKADLCEASGIRKEMFGQYDLIGFGSGIFHGKHHAKLCKVIEDADIRGKNVFAFSTSGMGGDKYNRPLKELLQSRGALLKGSFGCRGYDTYGIFKWFGGIAKGRPDGRDLERARAFAGTLAG